MAMTSTKLGNELAALTPTNSEATAVSRLATAWNNYFLDSTVLGAAAVPAALVAAKAAMQAALVGLSTGGAAAIQAGIIAYWGVVVTVAPTIWISVPPVTAATVPPTLSGIAAALTPVFASNTSGSKSLVDSMNAIAAVLHPNGGLGGIATLSGPPGSALIL
jgi:hypothetical protein